MSAIAPAAAGILLYTRSECPLCDDAWAVLDAEIRRTLGRGADGVVRVMDIDDDTTDLDAATRERYATCIPVVVVDGVERFVGRVPPVLLRRLLRARRRGARPAILSRLPWRSRRSKSLREPGADDVREQ